MNQRVKETLTGSVAIARAKSHKSHKCIIPAVLQGGLLARISLTKMVVPNLNQVCHNQRPIYTGLDQLERDTCMCVYQNTRYAMEGSTFPGFSHSSQILRSRVREFLWDLRRLARHLQYRHGLLIAWDHRHPPPPFSISLPLLMS